MWSVNISDASICTDPKPRLRQPKIGKKISDADRWGLAAIEAFESVEGDPFRRGVFVGAPASVVADHDPYMAAQERSTSPEDFGRESRNSNPNTLLRALPNNVLAYGVVALGARGPHSNYTCHSVSGMLALIQAAKHVQRDRLDLAYAGGFCGPGDPYQAAMHAQRGWVYDRVPAGAFLALTKTSEASAIGTLVSGYSLNQSRSLAGSRGSEVVVQMVGQCLHNAGIACSAVNVVYGSVPGDPRIAEGERSALQTIFGDHQPSYRASHPHGEAGGLLEMLDFCRTSPGGCYGLFLQATPFGQYACVLLRSAE